MTQANKAGATLSNRSARFKKTTRTKSPENEPDSIHAQLSALAGSIIDYSTATGRIDIHGRVFMIVLFSLATVALSGNPIPTFCFAAFSVSVAIWLEKMDT